ncbi:MAG: ATP-binding protein [Bacteroidales bacterium]
MENHEFISFTIPNKIEYIDITQFFVREVARSIGFMGTSLNQIDIAIEEAVSNVMKHAYDAEESKTFEIICQKIPDGIKIILKETGMPFDPNRIARFNITKNIGELSTEGLGIYMIQKVMDDLTFHNLGHHGKETHMIKYLRDKEVELSGNQMIETRNAEKNVIAEKIEYAVRAMEEHEAIEVSKCAYISHGYSFFDDHIYYPDRLVEMNHSGEMFSAVAVTTDNIFMGHCALVFQYPEDEIAELTFAFVNMEYRGQGALNRLVEFLFSAPLKRELKGVYAYAVANHIFTQKSMVRFNILDCGLLLATSPALWKFKGISDDTTQRISVVLGFKYTGEPEKLTLYPPEHHREMVRKLYENIGAVHELKVPGKDELSFERPDCVLKTSINELEGCGEIFIDQYGENILTEIRKSLRSLCVKHIEAINIFLKLADPGTYFVTAEFEKMGFFFAGILPGSRIGDALILQYLNNVDFDYGKVVLYQDFTRELLEYIRQHDPNEKLQDYKYT